MGNQLTQTINEIGDAIIQDQQRRAELGRLFNQFDSNNKGWLSETDMVKMICKATRRRSSIDVRENPMELILWTPRLIACCFVRTETFTDIFDEADADQDGRISRREFIAYAMEQESRYNLLIRALDRRSVR